MATPTTTSPRPPEEPPAPYSLAIVLVCFVGVIALLFWCTWATAKRYRRARLRDMFPDMDMPVEDPPGVL